MNKLIDNYNNSLEALSEYFEVDNFGSYLIQECAEDYWEVEENHIYFGTSMDNFEYSSKVKQITRKEDITAVLLASDFGDDDYWCIFYTNKEVNSEDR